MNYYRITAWLCSFRVSLLLEHRAATDLQDEDGDTALHFALSGGENECVKLLLKSHANPNVKDKAGRTPLSFALTFKKSPEIIHLLKAAGATE